MLIFGLFYRLLVRGDKTFKRKKKQKEAITLKTNQRDVVNDDPSSHLCAVENRWFCSTETVVVVRISYIQFRLKTEKINHRKRTNK